MELFIINLVSLQNEQFKPYGPSFDHLCHLRKKSNEEPFS